MLAAPHGSLKILRTTGIFESEARVRNPTRIRVIRQTRMVRQIRMTRQIRPFGADGCDGCLPDGDAAKEFRK